MTFTEEQIEQLCEALETCRSQLDDAVEFMEQGKLASAGQVIGGVIEWLHMFSVGLGAEDEGE